MKVIPDIEKHPPAIPGFRISYLLEILSVISVNIRRRKEETPLKMVYLRKLIPQADQYLKYLIEEAIIQRIGSYRPGKQSYKYKYTPEFKSRYKIFDITDAKLIRRIECRHLKRNNSKKYPGQNKFIRQMTIEPEALKFITATLTNTKKFNYATGAVTKILNRDIFYSVNITNGRYDSNLTNLPSDLRPFIRINGQSLLNIDIKNSQPYLLTVLLTSPGKAAPFAKSKNFSMLLESLQGIEALDVKLYVSLVISGKLYEYIWQEFKKYDLNYKTRDAVKRQVFIVFSVKMKSGINSVKYLIVRSRTFTKEYAS